MGVVTSGVYVVTGGGVGSHSLSKSTGIRGVTYLKEENIWHPYYTVSWAYQYKHTLIIIRIGSSSCVPIAGPHHLLFAKNDRG